MVALCEYPRQGHLRQGQLVTLRNFSNDIDDLLVRNTRLDGEARVYRPHIVGREGSFGVDRSRQEAATERRERDEGDVVGRTPGHDFSERIARPQRQLRLQRGEREGALRRGELCERHFRHTNCSHFAGLHHLSHRAHRFLDGDRRVGAV